MIGERFTFSSLDFFELVDFGVFPVIRSTNSLGEERLKVRIGARRFVLAGGGRGGLAGLGKK